MRKILSPEEIFNKFMNWFDKEKRNIFIFTFIVGLIINILVITNDIISTDAILATDVYMSDAWSLSIGRWMLKYVDITRFALSSSVVCSVISLLFISLTTILLIDLFKINKKTNKYLFSLLIASSPFLFQTLMQAYVAPGFSIAFFLSVGCVYSLYNIKNEYISVIVSSVLLAVSIGLYQAYIGVACALCVLLPLVYLLREENTPKEVLTKVLKSLLMGIIGVILYEVILHITLNLYGVTLDSYGGANQIGLNTILNIPHEIINSYKTFFNYFFNNEIINNIIYRRQYINIVFMIVTLLIVLSSMLKNKNRKNSLFIFEVIVLILLIPIATNIIGLIAPDRPMYVLMSAPFILIYLFTLSLIEKFDLNSLQKITSWIIVLITLFVINSYFVMANATYMSARITKEKMTYHTSEIISDIYKTDGYYTGIKVLFIGSSTGEYFQVQNRVYDLADNPYLFEPIMWSEPALVNRGWHEFIKYYLGINLTETSLEDYNYIINTNEYKEMGTYPNDYIKVINDILVVKVRNV